MYNFFLDNLLDLNLSIHTNDSELQLDFLFVFCLVGGFLFVTESLLFGIQT